MSQENVEAVREAFEQFVRGNFSGTAELPEEFEVVTAHEMPDAGTYRGEAARKWLMAWVDSFESLTLTPVEILEGRDDTVMVEFVQRGIPRGGSTPVELRTWSVTTLRGDVFTRYELFQSRDEALEAAGLKE
jgi:ketosteroid isomerase-like protein